MTALTYVLAITRPFPVGIGQPLRRPQIADEVVSRLTFWPKPRLTARLRPSRPTRSLRSAIAAVG